MRLRRVVRTRRQWDRFCPWVAPVGGTLGGIVYALPALSLALGAPPWLVGWHHVFRVVGDVLLIRTISVLCRVPRRRLFWVLVPPPVWLAWSVMDRVVTQNWPGLRHDLSLNALGAGLLFVFSCLSSLLTGKFGRGLEEEDAEPDAADAMRFDYQEGVWPPAPRLPDASGRDKTQ